MLTLADAKQQLRIPTDYTSEDALITRLMEVAKQSISDQLGRHVNWGNVNMKRLKVAEPENIIEANAALEHAVLLLLGHYWENREATAEAAPQIVPLGVAALINPYRILGV